MWVLSIAAACSFGLATAALGADLSPFHSSILSDDTSVALTVRSVTASMTDGYDYDVTIGLREQRNNGRTVFVDHGNHQARVKCLPGKVFVGGREYTPFPVNAGLDWKEDLVESLCATPQS